MIYKINGYIKHPCELYKIYNLTHISDIYYIEKLKNIHRYVIWWACYKFEVAINFDVAIKFWGWYKF